MHPPPRLASLLAGISLAAALASSPMPAEASSGQATTGSAVRQASDDRCWVRFTEVDFDNDGRIDAAEAKRHRNRMFEIDDDKDGNISRAEFDKCVRATPARPITDRPPVSAGEPVEFGAWDRNGDGIVTQEEYLQMAEELYRRGVGEAHGMAIEAYAQPLLNPLGLEPARLDWNGDRRISPDEASVDAWYSFAALDTNEDARLTLEEWRDRRDRPPGVAAAKMFAFMDRDGDGRITAAESARTSELVDREGGRAQAGLPVWLYRAWIIR